MFLILEFTACFIAVCFIVFASLAVWGLGFALTVIARKSAKALHCYYRTRLQLHEVALLSSNSVNVLPISLPLADCAL